MKNKTENVNFFAMLKRMSRVNVSGHAIDGGFPCSATGQICVTTGVKPNIRWLIMLCSIFQRIFPGGSMLTLVFS